ncbi:MAG: hypothetical protein R3F30_00890 [Planctomycetota bacterium]
MRRRTARLAALLPLLALVGSCSPSGDRGPGGEPAAGASLPRLVRTIPMPGLRAAHGGFARLDHLGHDPATGRMFVAAVGCDGLAVVDLAAGRHLRTLGDLAGPQGVAVVPGRDGPARVFVACSGDGMVHAFDARSLERLGSVLAGEDADNIRWDPRTRRLYVGCGGAAGGSITALDPDTVTVVGRTPLPAHAESFQLDADGPRMFVNVPGAKLATADGAVLLADREAGAVEATWDLHDATRNFPMAWVPEQRVVLTCCRGPEVLLALDADSGAELARIPSMSSDDLFFDAPTGRVLVIGSGRGQAGAGLQVVAMPSRGQLGEVGIVPLPAGTRTGLLVPGLHRLFVAVPRQADGTEAELREYRLD